MDSLITINTDGLAKCLDIIAYCTGWHAHGIKMDAKALAYADELAAETANRVALIKEQGNNALANYVLTREERKASNVATIAQKAAEQFAPGEQVPEESPAQDWLNRYFDYAENISEEDMQNLWAKLLADEIKRPRTFSKRTLDVVRNLSSEEAQLMTKYAGRVIGEHIPSESHGEELVNMSKLDDAGLINSSELSWHIKMKSGENRVLCADKQHIFMIQADVNVEITYGMRLLTESGKQIIKLIEPGLDLAFVEQFAESIVQKFRVSISMHPVNYVHGTSYNYQKEPIWVKTHKKEL